MSTADTRDASGVPSGIPPLLATKYRIRDRVGEGGMGVVYSGDHRELGTRVAIKVLQPRLAQDPTARARFLREARLAASIEGEHSTRILDVGSDGAAHPYMVMEYLVGEAVDARLAREGKFDLSAAATMVMQLLDALAEAHAKGLVHRDLKPGNLFLVEKPGEPIWIKVMDFGISKAMTEHDDTGGTLGMKLTEPRTLLGSPQYMSPEQLRDSASVDARSDLWACGVLLFELLTGTMPFEAPSLPELYAKILGGEPKTFAQTGVASLPTAVVRLVERCVRKNVEERPRNVYELAFALAPFANDSARALLPRIRAWCRIEEPARDAPMWRSIRVIPGIALVLASGAVAFVLASVRAGTPEPASSSRATTTTSQMPLPLEPPPARPAASATAEAITPSSSAATPRATSWTPNSARRPEPARGPLETTSPRRIQDLDAIELIR